MDMGRLRHVSVVFFAVMILSSVPAGGVKQADPNDAKPTSAPAGISSVKADNSSSKEADKDLFSMSLEELMEVEVTSSARRAQPISHASSAMYVITAEDIRQSGVTSLQDLFRFVPGMEIAQMRNELYRTGIRGSIARQENLRTLYLIDGRPLYEPVRNRVVFSTSPLFLDNIERIEIIRGPGGVAWGESSMNGVINIITKKAKDTQGSTLYGAFGNRALQDGFYRLGGSTDKIAWRGTTGAYHSNGSGLDHGNDYKDFSQGSKADGRVDMELKDGSNLSFAGGHLNATTLAQDTTRDKVQYAWLRWDKELSDNSSLQFQWNESFYDAIGTRGSGWPYDMRSRVDMWDLSHHFFNERHNIVTGVSYSRDNYATYNRPGPGTGWQWRYFLKPEEFTNDVINGFIEDEITLRDNLWLTLGTRLHYNEMTHYDWSARAALVWEFAPKHFLRGMIARTFRRPVVTDMYRQDVQQWQNQEYYYLTRTSNRDLDNEEMLAYEIGYRGKFAKNFELNVEGFLYKHHDLIVDRNMTAAERAEYVPLYYSVSNPLVTTYNNQHLTTYGLETSIDWKPYKWWLVNASHSYEHQTEEMNLRRNRVTVDAPGRLWGMTTPKHKITLINRFHIDDTTTLNIKTFWTDPLYNNNNRHINSFWRHDFRLAKRFWNNAAEFAIGVNNLQQQFHDEGHYEYTAPRLFYVEFYYNF